MNSRLYLEPWNLSGDTLEVAACLEQGSTTHRLWWKLPVQWRDAITQWADPFVVGFLFPMMQTGADVVIEGNVSPSLLKNLELYAAIWRAWIPARYKPVNFKAQRQIESPVPYGPQEAIVPFSCGVDSSYTVLRHTRGLVGRRNRKIGAAVLMHGFDIWLDEKNASEMYQGILSGAQEMLSSINVPCIPISSNFHELPTIWADSFGTHLVCGLMLFSGRFAGILMPNNNPYPKLEFPWGHHPASDRFLGSERFAVQDDGGENSRLEKIELISTWSQAMKFLRVCYSNPGDYANCCRCEKCIRTILGFRIFNKYPAAFKYHFSRRDVRRARFHFDIGAHQWAALRKELQQRNFGDRSLIRAMRAAERRYLRRQRLKAMKKPFVPLRNQLRKLFRGSTLSRRELAKMRTGADACQTCS